MCRFGLVLLVLLLLGPASVSAQGAPRAGDYWCMIANETDRVGDPLLLTRYAPVLVIGTQAGDVAYHMRPGDQPWHQSLRT